MKRSLLLKIHNGDLFKFSSCMLTYMSLQMGQTNNLSPNKNSCSELAETHCCPWPFSV